MGNVTAAEAQAIAERLANPQAGHVTAGGYRMHRIQQVAQLEHVLIVERVLGFALPAGAQVHHVNGDGTDNRHENLVVCPDQAYHSLLHQRARALDACGHADWRKCPFCKTYAPTENMDFMQSGRYFYHRNCRADYYRGRNRRS